MPNPLWPSTLPNPEWGLTKEPTDNSIRSQVEAGVAKMRRRYTKPAETINATVMLTDAQMPTLDTFVKTTLKDVLPFDWTDFVAGGTVTYRFLKRPTYKRVSYNNVQATLQLEQLP